MGSSTGDFACIKEVSGLSKTSANYNCTSMNGTLGDCKQNGGIYNCDCTVPLSSCGEKATTEKFCYWSTIDYKFVWNSKVSLEQYVAFPSYTTEDSCLNAPTVTWTFKNGNNIHAWRFCGIDKGKTSCTVDAPSEPTKSGYIFNGWSIGESCDANVGTTSSTFTASKDQTWTACWIDEDSITVTLDGNGGSFSSSSYLGNITTKKVRVITGEKYGNLDEPIKYSSGSVSILTSYSLVLFNSR